MTSQEAVRRLPSRAVAVTVVGTVALLVVMVTGVFMGSASLSVTEVWGR